MGQRQSEIIKNHMEVYWHDYASASKGIPITEAGLVEKASVIGRTGLMLLECGTGAWRVRSSMNTLSRELGVTTTADIGLLSMQNTFYGAQKGDGTPIISAEEQQRQTADALAAWMNLQ